MIKKLIKYLVVASFALVFAVISVILYANFTITRYGSERTYSDTSEIPYNKVGLLLGTSKYVARGRINLYYKYRIDAAQRLFTSGKIDYILVSGDNATVSYNEPATFKKDLIAAGIPEDRIVLDYAGFRTLDSVVRCKKVFGQDSVTVISQPFHTQRAIYLANNRGLHAIGYNAKDVAIKSGIKVRAREYLARVKVFLDIMTKKEPKFLGPMEEI